MDYIVILHSFLAFKQDIPASQVLFGLELRSLRHGLLHFRGCFKRNRLGATCLTEDLEFTMKLALNNYKVAWAHNAVVYDEKPITLKQSWNQRKRWMQVMPTVQADIWARCLKSLQGRRFNSF